MIWSKPSSHPKTLLFPLSWATYLETSMVSSMMLPVEVSLKRCNVRRKVSDTSCARTMRLSDRTNRITCLKSLQSCPRNLVRRHEDEMLDHLQFWYWCMYSEELDPDVAIPCTSSGRFTRCWSSSTESEDPFTNVFQRRRSRTRTTDHVPDRIYVTLENAILDCFDQNSLSSSTFARFFKNICVDKRIRFSSKTTFSTSWEPNTSEFVYSNGFR